MKRIALAFHFHQLAGPAIRAAAAASYRPLLETLREHPQLPVHIHVSGPLLAGLPWYAPDVLDLLRHGADGGQFEVLGSTYAQNVPEATPSVCNELQLAAHREQLDRVLSARPVGFWNPGRCWSDAYLPLLAHGRFRYALVEDAALEAAGLSPAQAARVRVGEGASSLFLVPDHARLRAAVNLAIWSGQRRALEDALAALPDGATVAYAEDAAAVGLWAHRAGRAPAVDREHLGKLLSWLEHVDGVQVVHLGRHLEARPAPGAEAYEPGRAAPVAPQPISSPDGLVNFTAPPYTRGADFARDQRVVHYQKAFEAIARAFANAVSTLAPPVPAGARKLLERAREVFAACQLDFGMPGAGEPRWPAWELVRTSLLLLEAAIRAAAIEQADAPARPVEADRDHDGVKEVYLQVGSELAILTPVGGRALAWIDLESGEVLAGAALAQGMPGPFRSVAHPYAGPVIEPAAPVPGSPAGRVEGPARDAWFAPLLAGVVDLERLTVAEAPLARPPADRTHDALRRIGVFADAVDGELLTDPWPYAFASGEVRFETPWGTKAIRLQSGNLRAEYPAGYGGGGAVTVRNELLPDRRRRPAISAPPLRADAADAPVAVEVAAMPEPAFVLWEELPLAWVAGASFQPHGAAPLPAFKVDLTRHP